MAIMSIRSIIVYFCVLVVVRLMGKRQIGEMQPFEFVITLIIADLACIPMAELSVPLIHGIAPIFTLLIVHFLICFFARKSMMARYMLSGRPSIIISPRGINYNELRLLNMNLDDLMELVRGCGVFNIDEISYAILETNGKLCVMKKSYVEPVTRQDMKINSEENTLPINIIMDGKIMKENVKLCGIDDNFLSDCMKKSKIKNIKDVLLMTIDRNGKVYIQGRYAKEYYSFETDYNGGGRW